MISVGGTLDASILDALRKAVSGSLETDVDLSQRSRWCIGGKAAVVVTAKDAAEVLAVQRILRDRSIPFLTVGQTANLLFDSAGFQGVIMQLSGEFTSLSLSENKLWAGAGCTVRDVVEFAIDAGLTGIEHAAGVPGTIAGLVVMNGGTQRRGIGENVLEVEVLDLSGVRTWIKHSDADFKYRHSVFQSMSSVLLSVKLGLEVGDPAASRKAVDASLQQRKLKFPESRPNCGSTFLSDPKLYEEFGPPGQVIEEAGFKGYTVGGAQVSNQHANFVNNVGGATSDDVLKVIWDIRSRVLEETGCALDCEVKFVTSSGEIRPAHEAAEIRWGAKGSSGLAGRG